MSAFVLGVSVSHSLIRRGSIWTEAVAVAGTTTKMMADKCTSAAYYQHTQENGRASQIDIVFCGRARRRPRNVTFLTLIDGRN